MTRRLASAARLAALLAAGFPAAAIAQPAPSEVSGTLQTISGADLTLLTRAGTVVKVDATDAVTAHRVALLGAGLPVTALGTRDGSGVLHANAISRAKASPDLWPADR